MKKGAYDGLLAGIGRLKGSVSRTTMGVRIALERWGCYYQLSEKRILGIVTTGIEMGQNRELQEKEDLGVKGEK